MKFYFRVKRPIERWLCVERETAEDAEHYLHHDDEIEDWERISKEQLPKGMRFEPTGALYVSEGRKPGPGSTLKPSPRCDQCLSEMLLERVSTGTTIYECRDCKRSFLSTGGYYNSVGDVIDYNRGGKKCPVNPEEHTFTAVVFRKGVKRVIVTRFAGTAMTATRSISWWLKWSKQIAPAKSEKSLKGIRTQLRAHKPRVCVSEIYGDRQIDIWDLTTGRYFKISNATTPPTVQQQVVEVPDWVQSIIQTPSDDLLAEHDATWEDGASEKRMAIFTELTYRGVSVPH